MWSPGRPMQTNFVMKQTVFGKLDKASELSENKQIQASVKCFDKYDCKIVETMPRKRKRTKTN